MSTQHIHLPSHADHPTSALLSSCYSSTAHPCHQSQYLPSASQLEMVAVLLFLELSPYHFPLVLTPHRALGNRNTGSRFGSRLAFSYHWTPACADAPSV